MLSSCQILTKMHAVMSLNKVRLKALSWHIDGKYPVFEQTLAPNSPNTKLCIECDQCDFSRTDSPKLIFLYPIHIIGKLGDSWDCFDRQPVTLPTRLAPMFWRKIMCKHMWINQHLQEALQWQRCWPWNTDTIGSVITTSNITWHFIQHDNEGDKV